MNYLARFITRHPGWVLGVLVAITGFFAAFVTQIEFLSDYSQMLPQDDPVVAQYRRARELFGSQSVFMLAMAEPGGSVLDLPSLQKLYAITQELERLVEQGWLEEVISPANVEVVRGTALALEVGPLLPGPPQTEEEAAAFRTRALAERQLAGSLLLEDGTAVVLVLNVHPDFEDREDVLSSILAVLEDIQARYSGPEEFYVTGDAPLLVYVNRYMRGDLGLLLPVVVGVVGTVLLLSFRLWRGVFLPLAVVLVAVIWTLGFMALLGVKLTMISTFLPMLLVAVGSAYGIHVVNDYLHRAAEGGDRRELVQATLREMFPPVLGAALTTAAGFLTLLSAFFRPNREFGAFAAFGVLVAFGLTMTLIPALLVLLPRPKKVGRRKQGTLAPMLAELLGRRRGRTLAIAALVVAVFLGGVPFLTVESDMAKYFPADSPVIQGMDFVEERFGGSQRLSVILEAEAADAFKDPSLLQLLARLQAFLETQTGVGDTDSLADLVKETHFTLRGDAPQYYTIPDSAQAVAQLLLLYELGGGEALTGYVTDDFSRAQVTARVRSLGMVGFSRLVRTVEEFLARELPPGVRGYVTGSPSIYIQISRKLIQSQIVSLGTSLVGIFLIVSLLMGSLVAGGCALVPLIVAIAGNFGIMGYSGAYLDMATVMIASLTVGIGVDYAVHFLTRYRKLRARGEDHPRALAGTYRTAGRGIVYNALTITAGLLVLLLSHFGALRTFGWLVAVTMVTSSVGALLVLPAVVGWIAPERLFAPEWLRKLRPQPTNLSEVEHEDS